MNVRMNSHTIHDGVAAGGARAAGTTWIVAGVAGMALAAVAGAPGLPAQALGGAAVSGDGSEGFVLKGIDPFDLSGSSVSGAGDLNGDGIDDLIIGAFRADPNNQSDAGESYVVFGRTTGFPAAFELGSLLPPP